MLKALGVSLILAGAILGVAINLMDLDEIISSLAFSGSNFISFGLFVFRMAILSNLGRKK